MKKKSDLTGDVNIPGMKKLFRIIKLTSFFLLISIVSVWAGRTYSQTYFSAADVFYIEGQSAFQQKTVSGKVTDSGNQPLPGVNVVIKGTTQGTLTNNDGAYSLSNVPDDATLVFSFVGMKKQEIVVAGKTTLNVIMEDESIGLDEVVAVGYGTVKKQDLTGSVSKIKSNALEQRAISTLGEGLAGQLAGVRVQEKNAAPGAEMTITIRGINSINATNTPLYVIDGIPVTNIMDFNPNDIASIEVLKDASSAAIYGSRGANGVVLITTKKGTVRKPTFDFQATYGIQKIDKVPDMMNRDEYLAYNIWAKNYIYLAGGGHMSDPMSNRNSQLTIPNSWLNDPENLPNTDWFDALYRLAPMQTYDLNVSGGSDIGTFLISGSLMDQEGIAINTDYTRASLRLNTTLNVAHNIQIGMNIAPSFSTKHLLNEYNGTHFVASMPPIVPLNGMTQETGYTEGVVKMVNPIEEIKQTDREQKLSKVLTNIWAEWKLSKSVLLKSQYGFNYSDSRYTYFKPSNVNLGAPSEGSFSNGQIYNYTLNNTLTYNTTIKKLVDINFLLGQSIEGNKVFYSGASANGFPNDLIHTLNVASKSTGASTSSAENRISSFFSRLNFNIAEKYLVTLNIRRDGSSKFGIDTKWGLFPSASVGWKINKEGFLKDAQWLDLLKLRVMAGKAGNNAIGDFESIALLSTANYTFNNTIANGLAPSTMGNPDLGWETKVSKGIGLDFSAFENRIQLNLDFYNDKTTDMLLNSNITYVSGYGSLRQNIGSVQNKGWEFELTTNNLRGSLNWTTTFNLSHNENEVLSLGENGTPIIVSIVFPMNITQVGDPIGSFYMYKSDGMLLPEDFDGNGNALVPIQAGQKAGNVKIVDVSSDGVISPKDMTVVGDPAPDYIYGLNNTFTYKNFDLNVLLQGQVGGNVFFYSYRYYDWGNYFGFNSLSRWTRGYKPEAPNGENPYPNTNVDLTWDGKTYMRYGNSPEFSDINLYSTTFFRIKNITLGYNLPKTICNKIGFDRVRLYLNADNFYTWDRFVGFNPEEANTQISAAFKANDATAPGVSWSGYGLSRRYVIGVNLTF